MEPGGGGGERRGVHCGLSHLVLDVCVLGVNAAFEQVLLEDACQFIFPTGTVYSKLVNQFALVGSKHEQWELLTVHLGFPTDECWGRGRYVLTRLCDMTFSRQTATPHYTATRIEKAAIISGTACMTPSICRPIRPPSMHYLSNTMYEAVEHMYTHTHILTNNYHSYPQREQHKRADLEATASCNGKEGEGEGSGRERGVPYIAWPPQSTHALTVSTGLPGNTTTLGEVLSWVEGDQSRGLCMVYTTTAVGWGAMLLMYHTRYVYGENYNLK